MIPQQTNKKEVINGHVQLFHSLKEINFYRKCTEQK